ncbi:MAG: tRNA glutamyl-Q(34) synthetase GluQRS [Zoogloeaceae bacterium]|jgi:glutamyl-Q tRNA(Asp) synthetase|nr:tRNA glutamyl-Q(34) synthetase GluQRS [Zoogloeaceae bacterium]
MTLRIASVMPRACGRFAPTPSGALHFGSLIAAFASCLEARTREGDWLLRMEDADTPRNVPGAADEILRTLEKHGFSWDAPVLWQSRRADAYRAAFDALRRDGWLYPCGCSRAAIAAANPERAVDGGFVYPGFCRNRSVTQGELSSCAWRMKVSAFPFAGFDAREVSFVDAIQGTVVQNLERAVGDFVLRRADGFFAYQLTVVVDDAWQGVTHIVRGADLLDSTARQIYLQRALGLQTPEYAHLPVAVNDAGEKLSKQTHAAPLDASRAAENLFRALVFLGQSPPPALGRAAVSELWEWALLNWRTRKIPRQKSRSASEV